MNTRSRATLTAMVATLALPWLLAGCGTAGGTSPAAGTPPTTPPAAAPVIIFAPEGRLGSVPASLKAAADVLTVTGRLLSVGSPPGPMLQVFAAGDPPGRPQEARLVLRDPANRLPAATGAGLFVTVRGRFAPTAGPDITVGTLDVAAVLLPPAGLDAAPATADHLLAAAAATLAAHDYGALSLPAFVPFNTGWHPTPDAFRAGGSQLLGITPDGAPITAWDGPTLPAHPDRPRVTRRLSVYTLLPVAGPPTLIATITGQADE